MIRASHRIGAVLVLITALTGVPALAGQGHPTEKQSHRPSAAQELRATLTSAWRQLTSLWATTGSGLDPFGNPLSATPPSGAPPAAPTQDNGSRLDPFG